MDIIIKGTDKGACWHGDASHLGEIYPFEEPVIKAYFGGNYRDPIKRNLIWVAYFKVRQPLFMQNLAFNSERRAHMWNLLCLIESDMHLPFRAIDGRDGNSFSEQLPEFGTEPIKKIAVYN